MSQNPRQNYVLYQGFAKALPDAQTLLSFHLIHQRLSTRTWEALGAGLGSNKSVLDLSFNVCNLGEGENMAVVAAGLQRNAIIQRLDLSDNNLGDEAGVQVLTLIKCRSEKRDNAEWCAGLRKPRPVKGRKGGRLHGTPLDADDAREEEDNTGCPDSGTYDSKSGKGGKHHGQLLK